MRRKQEESGRFYYSISPAKCLCYDTKGTEFLLQTLIFYAVNLRYFELRLTEISKFNGIGLEGYRD